MLKWTTQEEFSQFRFGKELPDNWQECLFYAETMIDYVTLHKVKPEELSEEVLGLVKKATYCQANYYAETGLEMDMLTSGNVGAYQLGQMSIEFKEQSSSGVLSPQALRFLYLSGLMYRGIK